MPFLRTSFILLCSADIQPVGRVDYSLLSDQSLLELFIANVDTRNSFRNTEGDYLDIHDWDGVTLRDDNVFAIDFFRRFGEGTLNFEAIPTTARKVSIRVASCTGTVPWEKLSDEIRYWSLFDSPFEGTVDLTVLPRQLITFEVVMTNFSGTLDFGQLPQGLVMLQLSRNKFTGRADLRPIQKPICGITDAHYDLSWNLGTPTESMGFGINLSCNGFEGDVLVRDVHQVLDMGKFEALPTRYMVDDTGERRGTKHFPTWED